MTLILNEHCLYLYISKGRETIMIDMYLIFYLMHFVTSEMKIKKFNKESLESFERRYMAAREKMKNEDLGKK